MITKKEIKIIKLRKSGFKQKEIAKKLKISQPAISKFEKNVQKKIIDSINVIKLSKELGVKIET